jgi:hypothetical protein
VRSRNWIVAAGVSLLLAALMSGYGAWRMVVPDKKEFCTTVLHQRYDPAYALDDERFFPLTQKCNASYDLVPAFVNPSIAVFLGLTVVCTGVGAAVRRRHPALPR